MNFTEIFSEIDLSTSVSNDISGFTIAMLIAIVFGLLLYLLYNLYFHDNEPQDGSLARSLILLVPALTATFWMIQSSIILSLGLLGSLSFVRFRTPVKRAEDVTFIVIAISSAIACATYSFAIGGVLIAILFTFTIIRNSWSLRIFGGGRFAVVTYNSKATITAEAVKAVFKTVGLSCQFVSSRNYDGITSFVFNVPKMAKEQHDQLSQHLLEQDPESNFNIFYPNDRIGV